MTSNTYDITIEYVDEIKCRIITSKEIFFVLRQKYSFYANGYQFHPKFKQGLWDGRINLIDGKGLFYNGLLKDLLRHCKSKGLSIKVNSIEKYLPVPIDDSIIKKLADYVRFSPYDYQQKSTKECLSKKKLLVKSPTSSGKSCIIYMLYRYCVDNNLKLLITVPSTSLVEQLYSDFEDYCSDDHVVSDHVAKIYAGQDKEVDKLVYISTWQSCSKMDTEWLSQFKFYICDECHLSSGAELSKIIENLKTCEYRIGLTGTLNGTDIHEIEMHARFGDIFTMVTTRELINRGIVTDIKINAITLTHDKETIKDFHTYTKKDYMKEIEWLINYEPRNNYIISLVNSLNENSIVLFDRIEIHGLKLLDRLEKTATQYKKKVYYIAGSVKTKEREKIRQALDEAAPLFFDVTVASGDVLTVSNDDYTYNDLIAKIGQSSDFLINNDKVYKPTNNESTIVSVNPVVGCNVLLGTYGTLSTGINIKKLHHLIFCHPFKSKIRNLQSIGRILRKSESKDKVYLYDLIDDYRKGKIQNHTYKHGVSRIELYEEEEFDYELVEILLG